MAENGDFFLNAKESILSEIEQALSGQIDSFIDSAYTFGRFGVQIYVLWYAYTVIAGEATCPYAGFCLEPDTAVCHSDVC